MPMYYTIITDAGQTMLAEAMANDRAVILTQFSVGDGGGAPITPDPAMTALVNEVYRGNISSLTTSPEQPNAMVAQLIIPKESGGYTVREVGLHTSDGTLFSVANYPDQPKPPTDSGYAVKLDMRYVLVVSDTSAITVVIPPGDYLTEPYADTIYLRQDQHLAEIAAQGETAQQAARDNLGLGTAATHDAEDFLPSSYTAPVTSVNGETGDVQLSAVDVGAVATVNNVSPDANGNVVIDIPPPADLSNYYTKTESDARFNRLNTASKAANGWHQDGSTGVIDQWCEGASTSGIASVTVTFPKAFPGAVANVQVTTRNASAAENSEQHFQLVSQTPTQCVVYAQNNYGSEGPVTPVIRATGW